MLSKSFLTLATLILLSACGQLDGWYYGEEIPQVVLEEADLLEVHYSLKAIPPCLIELAPLYQAGACFVGHEEDSSAPIDILFRRFSQGVEKIEKRGRGGLYEPESSYEIYQKAFCTLGTMQSCALDKYLRKERLCVSPQDVAFVVSGEAKYFYEELVDFYPQSFDPKTPNDFRNAITDGLRVISECD